MAESDKETLTVTTPKTAPLSSLADGVAGALESLAKKVRKGQVFGFTLVWMGGPTLQLITSPENPAPDVTGAANIPVPDLNDPKEHRRAEVAAYEDGMYKALSESPKWSTRIGDRLKEELPEAWEHARLKGEAAHREGMRYIEGEVTDPEVHQKAINDWGSAWRAALEKLSDGKPAGNGVASAKNGADEEYPF